MMSILVSIAVLFACQILGDVLHRTLGLPVPGPVLGIGLLLLGLCAAAGIGKAAPKLPAADALLSYLSLFFVPLGVDVVMHFGRLGHIWPGLLLTLLASSIVTLAVAGRVTQILLSRERVAVTLQDRVTGS